MINSHQNLWVSAAVVIGWFVLTSLIAAAGYRKERHRDRVR